MLAIVENPAPCTIAAARTVAETLRADAQRISEHRSLPAAIIQRLREAGLLNMLKPVKFGGSNPSLRDAMQVSRELARGDASTAWVHSVYLGHEHILGCFPEETQQSFWNSADVPLCASSLSPTGRATTVEGGFELSGEWAFCSGIDHAQWILLGAIVGMIPGERPMPDRRLFLLPTSACTIVDDWHVLGLRGTGSKSVAVDRHFVPDAHIVADSQIVDMTAPGVAANPQQDYRYPAWALLSFGLVGLAPSIACAALDQTVADLRAGAGRPNPMFDARRAAAHYHLAEAAAKIEAAEGQFDRVFDETFALVAAGEELTMDQRVRNRRDQCFATRTCLDAVLLLLSIGGARGLRESSPVQRAFRDLLALNLHPANNWDSTALSFGSFALGGPTTEPIV